ncbi:MAG: endolytic transglycosylase MltG, partial [Candidatus Wolfebacteria bacterium]|nr:endolytic transglycosylase MltG [Candidatus Wolfebacteria bacterium]
ASEFPFLAKAESFEGFLFPDTYRFERQSSVVHVLSRFLMNFQEKVWARLAGREDWYDRLILASFLEREVPEYEDRRLVAGVLQKRLTIGMPLQVDATISYAKCNGTFLTCEKAGVGKGDLDISSPYNTYLRRGWTPTPISNPGEEAVRAATLPEKSSYLYYLSARETGETVFSRTLEEHNRNRVKYL